MIVEWEELSGIAEESMRISHTGDGKTGLDTHYATVSFWLRKGVDLGAHASPVLCSPPPLWHVHCLPGRGLRYQRCRRRCPPGAV